MFRQLVCQCLSDNLRQSDGQTIYLTDNLRQSQTTSDNWTISQFVIQVQSDSQRIRQTDKLVFQCLSDILRHPDNQAICHPVPIRPSDGQTVGVPDYVRHSDSQIFCHPVSVRQSDNHTVRQLVFQCLSDTLRHPGNQAICHPVPVRQSGSQPNRQVVH